MPDTGPYRAEFQRTPNNQNAAWFLDLHSAGRLDLDPPYQRRSIWNQEFRQFFIDSVIRNYPTASIFLEADIHPPSPNIYRVIDGKQRLSAIIDFVSDRFPTPDTLEDAGLDDRYFSDLPEVVQAAIYSYKFTVEEVQDTSPAELNQTFDRLNRNVARLNKQELRHARFGGEFITRMTKFAEDPFWSDIGLVTPARIRRMLDVEYISELYIIGLEGIQDGKDYLDEAYSEYDDEIPEAQSADRIFRRVRHYLSDVNEHLRLRDTRFSNVADIYALWTCVALSEGELADSEGAADSLRDFQDEVEAQETQRSQRYLLAARQGSNKASNRETRASILAEVLAAS